MSSKKAAHKNTSSKEDIGWWERECVCICERERDGVMYVCLWECVYERERDSVCVCVCLWECVCVREREIVCVCEERELGSLTLSKVIWWQLFAPNLLSHEIWKDKKLSLVYFSSTLSLTHSLSSISFSLSLSLTHTHTHTHTQTQLTLSLSLTNTNTLSLLQFTLLTHALTLTLSLSLPLSQSFLVFLLVVLVNHLQLPCHNTTKGETNFDLGLLQSPKKQTKCYLNKILYLIRYFILWQQQRSLGCFRKTWFSYFSTDKSLMYLIFCSY